LRGRKGAGCGRIGMIVIRHRIGVVRILADSIDADLSARTDHI
jgi:hypothetical protein